MKVLADNSQGILWNNDGNETIQDAKNADAAKFRVGSPHVPGQSGGGGAVSFDVIEGSGETARRKEVAVVVGGFNGQQGEIGICVWNGQEPFGDATQIKVMEIRGNEIEFKVPVKGLSASSAAAGRFYHEGGRFVTIYQDDGHVVTYDMHTNPWRAMWSSWSGLLVPLPW